ncbi:MAG: cob(I)yrinic acid a,c-diamide adenosyltransferase [Firmicutes bacterium]|nr:cob(I)yrinic acid a,c-diamide adenosyltransferase [Bacillota bacterium]
MIHIYCGDGKGKTTAAMGLALRCIGHGGKVLVMQFLKDGTSGEIGALKTLGAELLPAYPDIKFSFKMTDGEKRRAAEFYANALGEIQAKAGDFDMVILDEILHAVNLGFIPLESLLSFLENKPEGLEVAMTGREPKAELMETADYITEMKKTKHPFDKGVKARKMVEF